MTKEIWKPVHGYEESYEVSSNGRVRSVDRDTVGADGVVYRRAGRVLSPNLSGYKDVAKKQHLTVELWKDNKRKRVQIHRLVAEAFLPDPGCFQVINHKDGNPLNNNVENLEWCTYSHNNAHAYRTGLKVPVGEKPVRGVDKRSGQVFEFKSIADAAEFFGVTRHAIAAAIHHYGRSKCCRGLYWSFIE